MATTSTLPAVKSQLVSKFRTALATAARDGGQLQVLYSWIGAGTKPETVFLGRHPDSDDAGPIRVAMEIPNIKAGRKHRQEDYTVPFTIWYFRPDMSSDDAETVEAAAFVVLGLLEDVLADDPGIGISPGTIQWASLGAVSADIRPFEKGWAVEIVGAVEVHARLT